MARKFFILALRRLHRYGMRWHHPEGIEYLKANKLKEGVVETLLRPAIPRPQGGPRGRSEPQRQHPLLLPLPRHHHRRQGVRLVLLRGQPTTFAPNQVIKGWIEAMFMEGGRQVGSIPSRAAYGGRQMGRDITPGAVLVFTLEIMKVGA